MRHMTKAVVCIFFGVTMSLSWANTTPNQTDDVSPIVTEAGLPFTISIEEAPFQLPSGVHSGVLGVYKGLWILIAGRHNGVHGFNFSNNFPAVDQNTDIYVVNPNTGVVMTRSLLDPSSGLNQQQIDSLSVTSPQGYQDGQTLYMVGGYGFDHTAGGFITQSTLTAFNLSGIVDWVTLPYNTSRTLLSTIQQVNNPIFQITGGKLLKLGEVMQLVFGQTFTGEYTDASNGIYSEQIRQFKINKNAQGKLAVEILPSTPLIPDAHFRRRDLNVVPALFNQGKALQYGFIAYSGVFTTEGGVWTVPVVVNGSSKPVMADPSLPTTFKQGMNEYVCATASLYSRRSQNMYHIFLGGVSYGYFVNGVFETDQEIPFINQVTTVKMDNHGQFTQYIMNGEYPTILSTSVNPGNPLLFGAAAYFVPDTILRYRNKVISLDSIRRSTTIGYVVGGIASTLPNTVTINDSFGSPYVFKVVLTPK